jgi:hypothetical protein
VYFRTQKVFGRIMIGEGSQIFDSIIKRQGIIGKGGRIFNFKLGHYTSINDSCIIGRTEIENSLIMAGYSHIFKLAGYWSSPIGQEYKLQENAN